MRSQRARWIWVGVALGAILADLAGSAHGAPTSPTVAVLPAPAARRPVRDLAGIARGVRDTVAPLTAFGKGEIDVSGNADVRFSGEGSLWVDKSSSVTLDRGTTFTKTVEADGTKWQPFRGTARVSGSPMHLRATGDRLTVFAFGEGKVTVKGENGILRLTKPGGQVVSRLWEANSVTEDFAKAEAKPTTGPIRSQRGIYGLEEKGMIPQVPPPVTITPRRRLPSEGGTTGTAPGAATAPAPAAAPAPGAKSK